jgi:two-component system CheB/CheR fusion protein
MANPANSGDPSLDGADETNAIEAGKSEKESQVSEEDLCPVVGIGASAGGLDAVTQMLKGLPLETGFAYVLVQHLDPSHESMLVDLLAQHTSMPVEQAEHGIKVEPDRVYVIPPNAQIAIHQGILELSPRKEDRSRNLPIDYFFTSLAEDQQSRAVGVVLSGAASDGTLGLEAIKAAGGITFAQDQTAKFEGMPRSAIAAGVVDFVLPPDGIARELASISEHSYFDGDKKDPADEPKLERVLMLLQNRTGVNFTQYKVPTIRRRLSRRMAMQHIENLQEYLDFLASHLSEIDALFDDLLIKVTEFFRDPDAYGALAENAFPAIIKDHGPDDPIRIWVPGCSTGKEVYSLAIALLEFLDRTQHSFPVQIFGTDVSERSIEIARTGRYPDSIASSVSSQRLKRFFTKVEGGYQITRSVRDLCIFSRHDITRDPPLAKMDLISCRNLLIYLGPVLQRRVLSIFLYALQPAGFLLLGNSESLGSLAEYFVALDSKYKIYCRNLTVSRPHFDLPIERRTPKSAATAQHTKTDETMLDRHADRMLLDEYAPSGFLVNERLQVVKFRGDVGPYLSPPPGDPELDVFRLVREDIAGALQSALQEARNSDREVRRDGINIHRNDGFRKINLAIWPLAEPMGPRYFLILFEEIHQHERGLSPQENLAVAGSDQDYQNVVSELSATRAYMQRLVEELRSANEEAQSTNEELQSTNEELQTAKEELQSSNEELTTTNEEMQGRNSELNQLNNDLVNLLSSMQMPIVMLDSELRIRRFTPLAEHVLSLIPTDIGRPISDLKSRIDVPDLANLLHRVVHSGEPLNREVRHENGGWFSLRIHPYRTSQGYVDGAVLQLLDVNQLKRAMAEIEYARDYAEAIINTVREPLLVLDSRFCVQTANKAFFDTFRLSQQEIVDRSIYEVSRAIWNVPSVVRLLEGLLLNSDASPRDLELERQIEGLGLRTFQLSVRRLQRTDERDLILLAIEDITDRKRTAEAKYRRLFETAQDGIIIIDAQSGEITDLNPFVSKMIGINRAALMGKRFWEAEPLKHLPNADKVLGRLQQEKVIRFPGATFKVGEGQREILVEIVANLYEEASREVAQFNIRDITERRQFDQQLQQTARLESLGILAGGIAHDFNNLLAGILGNAGLALGDAPAGSFYQSALKDVIRATQRASELTRQMLAYAGKGRLNVRPLDLSELVREISKLVESSIPKSVNLELKLTPDLPMTNVDAGQMQQVVMNLVINGAEAIGERRSGYVRVSTWSENLDIEDLRVKYSSPELSPGSYVILEVADNGCGMEERVRMRIFEPFFTTKFTGRGLGLAAVQGIVRGHRGILQVSSSPGKGSSFRMLLPAADAAKISPAPKSAPSDLRGTGLVLVVDDEEIVLQTTRVILERHGYQVITAANGELGVEAVRDNKEKLAAVILDLTMPVMGGEEALRHIKAIDPSLPVILSSGYDPSEAIARFGENLLAGFIQKPSTVEATLLTLKSGIEISGRVRHSKS